MGPMAMEGRLLWAVTAEMVGALVQAKAGSPAQLGGRDTVGAM